MENVNYEPGIYQWRNIITNVIYIGSTINIYNRYHNHLAHLRGKTHPNSHFQNAWNKYGEENFVFSIKEYVARLEGELDSEFSDRLTKVIEQSYLDLYYAQEYIQSKGEDKRFRQLMYNLCPTAGSSFGRVLENYEAWNRNKQHTDTHKENLKKAWLRRKENHPTKDSTRELMSKSISESRKKPEVKEKYQKAILNRLLITCPHCGYESLNKGNMIKCHFDRCKENPGFNHEAEEEGKQLHSKRLREAKLNLPLVKCPHCPKESRNMGNMKQNHFDNCKSKKDSVIL